MSRDEQSESQYGQRYTTHHESPDTKLPLFFRNRVVLVVLETHQGQARSEYTVTRTNMMKEGLKCSALEIRFCVCENVRELPDSILLYVCETLHQR